MASSYNALKLYKHLDNGTSVPFPDANSQIELLDWQYDAKRMGGAPLITATIKYPTCLDDLWGYGLVYVTYKGEEYILKQTPTSSYSNEEIVYKHEVEFISERYVLDNVYFYDVVSQTHPDYKPVTNSTKFSFFGDINEFVSRLNASFTYSNVGYSVVVDEDVTSESLLVSFEDKYMSEVLQEGYKNYGIPFYFVGKVVHYGYTSNVITHPIKYGVDQALLSIQKTNANTKVVTRITGVGSADNIPYWYPNDYESKEEVESHGGTWIEPQPNLMPPIYRESLGAQRFYNALNNTYQNPSGGYYTFTNPYVSGRQREWKEDFEDIKPTIKGMTNANGQRIDMFSAFAYDLNDSDEVDADGNYLHPYFFAKLRKMDGTYGFNLFDHSIDEEEMTIAITGGTLGACEFVIGVDEDSQKNPVQVDENGNLVRDADGNVVYTGVPQERQNDTQNYEVWVALRKDINTFGVIMPNATNNYKPNVSDTTFVILHIDLPKAYILAAEDRLKDALIRYMVGANNEHWNFSIGFSRIFFEENPSVLSELNENARVQVEYNNHTYELYISSYTYKKDGNVPLPQITVELAEELSISENPIQQAIDGVRSDILNNIGGSADFLKLGLKYFIRKDVDDIAHGKITFTKGLQVGNRFVSGLLGEGGVFRKDADGTTYIEADKLYIRMKAYFDTLEVRKLQYSSGNRVASAAGIKTVKVEKVGMYNGIPVTLDENGYYHYTDEQGEEQSVQLTVTAYRCYFRMSDSDGNPIDNDFVVGDLARAQEFNLQSGLRSYWRKVVRTNGQTPDEDGLGWIDLSNVNGEYLSGSDAPLAQDDIVQLGNVSDTGRQGAIIEYSTGAGNVPSYQIYQGINTFSLENKNKIDLGYNPQTGRAYMNVYGDFFFGNNAQSDGQYTGSYIKYNAATGALEIKGTISAKSPIAGTNTDLEQYIRDMASQGGWTQEQIEALIVDETSQQFSDIDTAIQTLQNQADGAIETWFNNGAPTLSNLPASNWNTDTLKEKHLGDLYYDNESGYAYRFIKTGNTYSWNQLSDSAVIKALANAAKAQDTADSKRKVFVRQPKNSDEYDEGDFWVNATYPATGTKTYENDILRAVTPKSAGVAFDINHWTKASKYTDDSALEAFLGEGGAFETYKAQVKTQLDGKAETWYQSTNPANNWTDTETKNQHIGDIWHNTSNSTVGGVESGRDAIWNGTAWVESDVPSAVYDKIDGKADIFVSKPTTYNINDMWIIEEGLAAADMPTGCKHKDIVISSAKRTNSYHAADWSKKDRYTDDTALTTFINGAYEQFKQDIQAQVDGKAETWYQTTDPSTEWDDASEHVGDIWHNSSSSTINGVEAGQDAIWNGTSWEVSAVPAAVFNKIDGKASIFINTVANPPSNYRKNDLWILPAAATINGVSYIKGELLTATTTSATYNAAHWTKKVGYTNDAKFDSYINQILNGTGATGDSATVANAIRTIRGALNNTTTIDGGLVLTSMIGMKDSSNDIWAGISGQYQANETGTGYKGHGIAAWYGGGMVDKEVSTSATNAAKSLFRFDGSGYLAGGNITWDKNGIVTIANVYSNVDGTQVAWSGQSLQYITNLATLLPTKLQSGVTYLDPKVSFWSLSVQGKAVATQEWVGNNYLSIAFFKRLFQAYNGTTAVNPNNTTSTIDNIKAMFGFWTDQYLSALGKNASGGSSGGSTTLAGLTDTSISNLTSGQVLSWNGSKWVNTTVSGGGADISDITAALSNYVTLNTAQTISGAKTFTASSLNIAAGTWIQTPNGTGLLVYKPSGNSSISSSQWGIGALDAQGVIRSNDNSLIHHRGGTNYTILDTSINTYLRGAINYRMYITDGSNTRNMWHRLGNYTFNSTESGDYIILDVYSGDGYNAYPVQSQYARIIIKSGWKETPDANASVGIFVEQHKPSSTYADIQVVVVATGYRTGEVWVLCPWDYSSGCYTISGRFWNWEHNGGYSDDTNTQPTTNQRDAISRSIAYKDDSVASAAKLSTARNLWGQSFDGTADVDGVILVHHAMVDSWWASDGGAIKIQSDSTESPYTLGLGVVSDGYAEIQAGHKTVGGANLILNKKSGNVGIGTTSPAAKLTVSGSIQTNNGRFIYSGDTPNGSFIGGVTSAILTCNATGTYVPILNAPTKNGRISLSTYPNSNNVVYLGYASSERIQASTNQFNSEIRWSPNANLAFYSRADTSDDATSGFYLSNLDTTTNSLSEAKIYLYNAHRNNENSGVFLIHGTGNLVIGGGEGVESLAHLLKTNSDEATYIAADTAIYLYANCGADDNKATARKGFQIDTSANIYPIVAGTHTNNVGYLGNASYRFAGLYSELVNTNSLTIGSCVITWDSTAGMLKFSKGIYSQESVSALGASNSSATAATTLAQLTDTTISNPSNGQVLTYSGGKWINKAVSASIDQATLNAALANYVTLSTAQTITALKTFTGGITTGWMSMQHTTDSSQAKGISWLNTSGTTIARILYHNTAQNILIDPTGATDPWADAVGKYVLYVGNNKLTYNTYPILTTNNFESQMSGKYVKVIPTSSSYLDNTTGSAVIGFNQAGNPIDGTTTNKYGAVFQWSNTNTIAPATSAQSNWYFQLIGTTETDLYWRRRWNGKAWETAKMLLDSGNYATFLNDVYVKKAGDTMTGNLNISGNGTAFRLIGTSYDIGLHLGSGGTNRGIYEWSPSAKWLLYFDANNTILNHGNLNLTSGSIITNHGSSNHVNGATNAVINCNNTSYGAIFNAPVKDGRVSLATYAMEDNIVYLNYFTSANVTNNTNTISHSVKWNASNGNLGIDAVPTTKLDVGGAVRSTNMVSTTTDGTAPFYASATTLCTNVNADLLDGWHRSDLLGYGYVMTNSSLSSYWCKAWDATVTNIGAGTERHMQFLVTDEFNGYRGIISVKIRQNGADGSGAYNFGVNLVELTGNLVLDRFRLYYNNSTGYVALYANVGAQWGSLNFTRLKMTGRYGELKSFGTLYSTIFSSAQTLPSSSYKVMVGSTQNTGDIRNTGRYLSYHDCSSSSWVSDSGSLLLMSASDNSYRLGMGVDSACAVIQGGHSGVGDLPVAINPKGGNVGIGTTTPTSKLHVVGTISATSTAGEVLKLTTTSGTYSCVQYVPNGGVTWSVGANANSFYFWNATANAIVVSISKSGSIVATGEITALSDMRYKNVVKEIEVPIEDIAKLPVFDFTWKDKKDDLLHSGSSAQAIQKLFPHNVLGKDELSVNYGATGTIIGILVARGLIKLGDKTKDEITALKDEIVRLKHRIKILEEAA